MNNDQEIILAKISAVYDKPPFVKMETGQMEMILKCVGLGAYYDKYREYLEPYWYNGRFQNPVESYRIFVGLNSIFEDLLNERKGDEIISLLTELGNYIPGTILSDEARFAADFNKLRQLYNLMGLQIVSMEVDEYSSKFQVEPYLNEGNQIIQSFGMERWLKSKYQDVYEAYESALNSFSSGDLGAAIESCRTALTGIFSKYKGVPFQKAKWMLGMATLTGDFTGTQSADASEMTSIKNEIEAMGKRDIADFFEENLEGSYKKTKAIYSIYSMLSDYGTHRLEGTVEVAKNEDIEIPVMCLTMLAGVLVQKVIDHTPFRESVDKHVETRIGSMVTDYLVGFGVASISITVVKAYLGPLLLLCVLGIVWPIIMVFVVGKNLFHDSWFERSIFIFGWCTGVVAIGVTLLRICDPEMKSGTLDDYGTAYTLISVIEVFIVALTPQLAVLMGCWKVGIVELLIGMALLFLCGKIYGWHKRKLVCRNS